MPQTCKACKHPQRKAIDAALAARESLRRIAGRFAISDTSLCRHKAHVSVSIVKAGERREERSGDRLLARLDQLDEETWQLVQTMKQERDFRGAIVGAREVRGCIETRASLLAQAVKVQAVTEPPSIEVKVIDISAEPATPATPQSLTE
jgi:hypothetical protein